MRILSILFALLVASCAAGLPPEDAPLELSPAGFADLPGWGGDRHQEALEAFKVSCSRITAGEPGKAFGSGFGSYVDWQGVCREAASSDGDARAFFERHFRPWQAKAGRHSEGLFTGYYEPSLRGSRVRRGPYQTPVRARPDDLVMVNLGEFRDELKGQRIAGRVRSGYLKPYEDREAIEAGKLPRQQERVIAWVADPVDVFFLQIQGSGRVVMPDGEEVRVGYDGQNGHPYYAIGRELVKLGELEKEEVSLQTIRKWLADNPSRAADIMNTNKSYVFFRELEGAGPLGGEGVPLSPGRSLAIDRSMLSYGVPLWVDIEPPVESAPPLRRLMVAQDTGGAIRGAVRGDVFWGHGQRAEHLAGHMKSKGKYWILLPLSVHP